MDEGEGGLSFDFEGGLDAVPSHPTASNPIVQQPDSSANITAGAASTSTNANNPSAVLPVAPTDGGAVGGMGGNQRRSFRQTVCRHWLRSLCMKGDACGFLHQYDKSRMPVCRFFRLYGECREQDCVYKHTNEDIKECNMYKLGFCPNGPDCRYRHAKLPGPPPPVEEVLQKIQQLTSYNHGNANRFYQNRNPNFSQQAEKPQYQQIPNGANQVSKTTVTETPNIQQRPQQVTPSQPVASQAPPQNVSSGQPNQANRTSTPLPQGTSRYFIVKSCNRENLELSVQQGVWATQRSNEAKLNEAFESVENVILIFSVNRTRHFQGCAKMTSRIGGSNTGGSNAGGNWKHAHGTGHYGRNFSVKWLKLCELSFHKTRHLRNPYNENLPVKISRDCQELEASVGEQLASLLYLEPDSELMAVWVAAEAKREEEKEKGLSTDSRKENPDIVLFEDNEEEEEEESEEEDETFGQVFIPAAQGRGRGRGMMWPPFMPLAPGARPLPGMRGFPPNVMGSDGFPFGGVAAAPEGFPMPDLFSMGHRPFGPYGPRFSGDFACPGPGMMFRGRPSQPGNFPPGGGFGMMMGPGPGPGPGRAPPPFMSGLGIGSGAQPRSVRPVGMPPPVFPPPSSQPSQNSNRTKRDQKATTTTERNDRISTGSDHQGKGQEITGLLGGAEDESRYQQQKAKTQGEDQFGSGNTFRNEESDSEDEAPRRSRHGEGKKKRRSSERDGTNNSSDQQTP